MTAYLQIAIIHFKKQITYRFDAAIHVLACVCRTLFASIVWSAIYASHQTIAGLTLADMLGYAVISAALSQMNPSRGVSEEISGRVRDGTFSKYMVLPAGVQGYFLAQSAGTGLFFAIVNGLAALLCLALFGIRLPLAGDAPVFAAAGLMIVLGMAFMIQLNFFLGLLTFRFQDVWIFLMIKENFMAFLTGALIPLALLGPEAESVMRGFPFYYVSYLPAMLLMGKQAEEALQGLGIISLWFCFFTLLNTWSYRRVRVLYDGVGI